jgi:hypothetical protein
MNLYPILKQACFGVLIGCVVSPAYASAIFLDSTFAPSVTAAAGQFDGSTLYLDVISDSTASYGTATAMLDSTITPNQISGTGSAGVYGAGEGAVADILVWFTLDKPESFTFSASGSGGVDYFNHGYANLYIYNKDTTVVSPITGTTGVLNPYYLSPSEVFLISGSAIATKSPGAATYPLESTFSFNLTLGAPVPVPASVWLFGSGLIGLVGISIRSKNEGIKSKVTQRSLFV